MYVFVFVHIKIFVCLCVCVSIYLAIICDIFFSLFLYVCNAHTHTHTQMEKEIKRKKKYKTKMPSPAIIYIYKYKCLFVCLNAILFLIIIIWMINIICLFDNNKRILFLYNIQQTSTHMMIWFKKNVIFFLLESFETGKFIRNISARIFLKSLLFVCYNVRRTNSFIQSIVFVILVRIFFSQQKKK